MLLKVIDGVFTVIGSIFQETIIIIFKEGGIIMTSNLNFKEGWYRLNNIIVKEKISKSIVHILLILFTLFSMRFTFVGTGHIGFLSTTIVLVAAMFLVQKYISGDLSENKSYNILDKFIIISQYILVLSFVIFSIIRYNICIKYGLDIYKDLFFGAYTIGYYLQYMGILFGAISLISLIKSYFFNSKGIFVFRHSFIVITLVNYLVCIFSL